ncbi:hypothetical protein ACFLQ0_06950 [Nitrospinota bacterium]
MMATHPMRSALVLDFLKAALKGAGEYNAQDQTSPVAIVWTDEERQWEPLVPRLRSALHRFLILVLYVPEERTGRAISIRYMIEHWLPETDLPEGSVPILYLTGGGCALPTAVGKGRWAKIRS